MELVLLLVCWFCVLNTLDAVADGVVEVSVVTSRPFMDMFVMTPFS